MAATNNGDGTWTLADDQLTTIANGVYDVAVTTIDLAGNSGNDATTNELTIDIIAPVITVSMLTTNDQTPALSGTIDDNAASISITVDGQTLAATNNGDGTWTLADNLLTAIGEGIYDIATIATDVLGNAGNDITTNELTIDLTAPVITVNALLTNDQTPTLTGTINDNAAAISITVAGQTLVATNNGDGTWTLADNQLTTIAEGAYDIAATATDIAGNAANDATVNELTIDITLPVVTVAVLTTKDQTPALTGAVDDVAAAVSITVAGQTIAAVNNGDGTWTLANDLLATIAEGVYDMAVSATDAAGNIGADATNNELTIDISAPVVTVNTLLTKDQTPALTGTVNDNTASLSLTVDGQILAATNNGDGTWTLADDQLTTLTEGIYDVAVAATDLATNVGTEATNNELTIDITSPVVTVNALLINDQTPALTGTVDDNTASISVTVDGQTMAAVNNGNGTWTLADNLLATIAEGVHDVSVTATDIAGNAGSDATTNELTIDITIPVIFVNAKITKDQTPLLTGAVDDFTAGVSIIVAGQTVAAMNNGNGTWTLADNLLSTMAEGTYDVVAHAADAAGNVGTDITTNELTIDTTAPVVTVNNLSTNDQTPALTGMVNDNTALIVVTVDGQTESATNNGDGTWTLANNALSSLAEGVYDVLVTAVDLANNAAADISTNELTIDLTAPIITINALVTNDQTPALTGTVDDNTASISVTVDGQTLTATNNSDGTWVLTDNLLTAISEGTYDVAVMAADIAGNVATDATTNELVIDITPPVVSINVKITNDQTPALSGTVNDSAAAVTIMVDGQTRAAVNNDDGTWALADNQLSLIAEGVYDAVVSATDAAGNIGMDATTSELTIDITAPVVTVIPRSTNDQTPSINGTINDVSAAITVVVGGQAKIAVNNGNNTWTLADNALNPLAEGIYDVMVTATDPAGNTGLDATINELRINLSAPTVTVDVLETRDPTPALTGTVSDPAASISVVVAGQTKAGTNNGDGTWILANNILDTIAPDTYDVAVTATDLSGNYGTDATINELVIIPFIDTNPPIVGYTGPNSIPAAEVTQALNGSGIMTINFKVVDSETSMVSLRNFEYSDDSGATWHAPVNNDASLSFGAGWPNNNGADYRSANVFVSAQAYAFTFNTKHADVTLSHGLITADISTFMVRFSAFDGRNVSVAGVSEALVLDNKAPVIASAISFTTGNPAADSTSIRLAGSFIETHPATNTYYYRLNGGAYSAAIPGTANTAAPAPVQVPHVLTGADSFNAVRLVHVDSLGNTVSSEDSAVRYVKPKQPRQPVLSNSGLSSLRVGVDTALNEAAGLSYAIAVDSAGAITYVQTDGSRSGTAAWQTDSAWGVALATGLSEPVSQYAFRVKSRHLHNSAIESDLSLAAFAAAIAPELFDTNTSQADLQAVERTDASDTVDIYYQVFDQDNANDTIFAEYRNGVSGNWTSLTAVTGSIGAVSASDSSAHKHIFWHAASQLGTAFESDSVQIRLVAKDAQNNFDTLVMAGATLVIDTKAPDTVTDLVSSRVSPTALGLAWTPSASVDADTIMIRYRNDGANPADTGDGMLWTAFAAISAADTITGLVSDHAYNIALFVKDRHNHWSVAACVADTTLDTICPAPVTGLHATALLRDSIAVSWTASVSADADSIKIVYRNDRFALNDSDGTIWGTMSAATLSDTLTGLMDSAWFYISAFVKDDAGNWSAADAGAEDSAFTPDTNTYNMHPDLFAGDTTKNLVISGRYHDGSGRIAIPILIRDRDNAVVTLSLEYSDGAAWHASTAGPWTIPTNSSAAYACSTWIWDAKADLGTIDTLYRVRFIASDGNESDTVSTTAPFLIDTRPPQGVSAIFLDSNGFINTKQPMISFQANGADTITVAFWDTSFNNIYKAAYAPVVQSVAFRAQGVQRIYVSFNDSLGNADTNTYADSTLYDSTMPIAAILKPLSGVRWVKGSVKTIQWSASDAYLSNNASVLSHASAGDAAYTVIKDSLADTGTFFWTVPDVSDSNVTVRFTTKDSACNITIDSVTILIVDKPGIPLLLAITPDNAIVGRDSTLQFAITGIDKDSNNIVTKDVTWSVIGNVGAINDSGLFTGSQIGVGYIVASLNGVSDTTDSIMVKFDVALDSGMNKLLSYLSVTIPFNPDTAKIRLWPMADFAKHDTLRNFVMATPVIDFAGSIPMSYGKNVTFSVDLDSVRFQDSLFDTSKVRVFVYDSAAHGWKIVFNTVPVNHVISFTTNKLVPFVAGIDTQAPVVMNTSDTINAARQGTQFQIKGTIDDNIINSRVTVYYRYGGSVKFDSVTIVDSTGAGYRYTLFVTDHGVEYFVRANDGSLTSVSSRCNVKVKVSHIAQPDSFPTNQWKLFSLPTDAVNDSLMSYMRGFGTNVKEWRLYSWEDTGYSEIGATSDARTAAGKAFWLQIRKKGFYFSVDTGYTIPINQCFTIALRPGQWTTISNPYLFSIGWQRILDSTGHGNMLAGPYTYSDSNWVSPFEVPALKPWEGYYVKNRSDSVITLRIPSVAYVAGVAKTRVPGMDSADVNLEWEVRDNSKRNFRHYFGVIGAKSTPDYDLQLDAPMPPQAPDQGFSTYFVRTSYAKGLTKLITDFSSFKDGGETWVTQVANLVAEMPYKTYVRGAETLPDSMAVYVVDRKRGIRINMKSDSAYVFIADKGEGSRTLQVLVGSKNYVDRHSADVHDIPKAFALAHNYPNPFNPVTVIGYTVPELGKGKMLVCLAIYDIKGQLVRTLINDRVEGGYYKVQWNGRTEKGDYAASGVYFYRMIAGTKFNKTMKMILIK
ncbi:MAG: hypothetical protein A2248_03965 [Candidatus Raymondbacteria bacterium RIFOXYA2_FULL_49_16]|nr:MAG: hypothetical protein A2248_03965 [Candidatus Raymondbacteria bacterium RIFOXYA2_FULL_49_16]OGP43742.1 MAG: hypothetical protein A2324_15530 [Candidatus Raymondbacteria bacterium RIFOXYB2_FULL_49_35]